MLVKEFKDAENGVSAHVFQMNDGKYSVTLHDDDADMTASTVKVFKDIEAAEAYAATLV